MDATFIYWNSSSSLFQSYGTDIVEHVAIKNYKYDNQTEYSIVIHKWRNNNEFEYELLPGTQIRFKAELTGTSSSCYIDDVRERGYCLLIIADSVEIIFDNSKSYLLKSLENFSVNILNRENYEYDRQGIQEYYSYQFTDEDYNHAEDCNGKCE